MTLRCRWTDTSRGGICLGCGDVWSPSGPPCSCATTLLVEEMRDYLKRRMAGEPSPRPLPPARSLRREVSPQRGLLLRLLAPWAFTALLALAALAGRC